MIASVQRERTGNRGRAPDGVETVGKSLGLRDSFRRALLGGSGHAAREDGQETLGNSLGRASWEGERKSVKRELASMYSVEGKETLEIVFES